ncbi:MAG: 1-deoxy-D-xylulose-5-phosphate synthase [Oscillospiraceae bacterium]
MYLEKIKSPKDLKSLQLSELEVLSSEMRDALLTKLSKKGGHIAPNLGMVELTIGLHYVFNSPIDKIVYDVSHQSYCHKMLTGRNDAFLYEDKYSSVSGYSNPSESEHDFFTIGHTSTSISLACGLAKARDVKNETGNIIAVIGDGSLSGGEAFEGLDYASELNSNFIIVVNDNDMSIAENHGGIYKNLKLLRDTNGKAECNLFRAMGLDYIFIQDGNNLLEVIEKLQQVKDVDHAIVVHVCTQKGKGYSYAEKDRETWHWGTPFDIATGKSLVELSGEDYGEITAEYLLGKMKKDSSIVAVTSATPTVFGFNPNRRKLAGNQFIDVGIAEENAVAMISGMAKNGAKPIYGVYSTFIQRTYDQLSQDLCVNNNPVTILTFSASVYGMNDVTHLGIFDIPMMSNIPNLVYLAPTCKEEYLSMMEWSIEQNKYPVAIRVPSNGVISSDREVLTDYSDINKYQVTKNGSEVVIIALGDFYQLGEETVTKLKDVLNVDATLINPRYITGVDTQLLNSLKENHKVVVTLEDGILDGGFGEKISRFYGNSDMKVLNFGLKKEFLDRYNVQDVLEENHLTAELIVNDVKNLL